MSTDSPDESRADPSPGCCLAGVAGLFAVGMTAASVGAGAAIGLGVVGYVIGAVGLSTYREPPSDHRELLLEPLRAVSSTATRWFRHVRETVLDDPLELSEAAAEGGFSNWARLCGALGIERRDNYPSTPLRAAGRIDGRIVEVAEREHEHVARFTVVRIDCRELIPPALVFRPKTKSIDVETGPDEPVRHALLSAPHDQYALEAYGDVDLERWSDADDWIDRMARLCEAPESATTGVPHRGTIADGYLRFEVSQPLQDLSAEEMDDLVEAIWADLETLRELESWTPP